MSHRVDTYVPLPQGEDFTWLQVSGVNPSSLLDGQPTHIENGMEGYAGRGKMPCYINKVRACYRDKH